MARPWFSIGVSLPISKWFALLGETERPPPRLAKPGGQRGGGKGSRCRFMSVLGEGLSPLSLRCCGLMGAGKAGGPGVRRGASGAKPYPGQGREERGSSPCRRPHRSTKRTPSLYYRNPYETAPRKKPTHRRKQTLTKQHTHRRGARASPREEGLGTQP